MRRRLLAAVLIGAAMAPVFGSRDRALGMTARQERSAAEASTAAALITRYRAAFRLRPVKLDPRLSAAAEHQARTIAQTGSLDHGDFASRMAVFGIKGKAAENLSGGVGSVEEALAQWQASPAHNANLLIPEFTRIGLARADSQGTRYGRYWALVLAR
jgi:uncharacterized protein YkwD